VIDASWTFWFDLLGFCMLCCVVRYMQDVVVRCEIQCLAFDDPLMDIEHPKGERGEDWNMGKTLTSQ
jgi:hypothetical protein